jgi:DNA repair exonuclease SbcCD ATPase subunit
MKEQVQQIVSLQKEIHTLKSITNKQANDLESLRRECEAARSAKAEVAKLKEEVKILNAALGQSGNLPSSFLSNGNLSG